MGITLAINGAAGTNRIVADGIVTDSTNLVLLFYLAQLFLRELVKSYRLLQVVPMDMSSYYGESLSCARVQPLEEEEEDLKAARD